MSNEVLASLFDENGRAVGLELEEDETKRTKAGGSTDMGNVSHVVPSIHPKFFIGTASGHTEQFAVAACGYSTVLISYTGLVLLLDATLKRFCCLLFLCVFKIFVICKILLGIIFVSNLVYSSLLLLYILIVQYLKGKVLF